METVRIYKRSSFWHAAGILAVVISLSYSAAGIIGAATPVAKKGTEGQKPVVSQGFKTINAFAPAVEKNAFGIRGARFQNIEQQKVSGDPKGLVLKGTITLDPGYAFIESKDGIQKFFRVGDDVFNAGTLKSVTDNVAYISSGGATVELVLLQEKVEAKPFDGSPLNVQDSSPAKAVKEMSFEKAQIKKFLDNPKEVLTDARLLPHLGPGGAQSGFVMKEVRPGGFYDNIGLRDGDVILRVNGMEITSPNDAAKIFSVLRELDKIELDIIRGGKRMTQVYHIN